VSEEEGYEIVRITLLNKDISFVLLSTSSFLGDWEEFLSQWCSTTTELVVTRGILTNYMRNTSLLPRVTSVPRSHNPFSMLRVSSG
jgi:hypothetical protein